MTGAYDAVGIGGGHNGLVAGAYLAKHGARTVVLEGRGKTGGAADTSAPWPEHPDIKVTTCSYVMSLMPPRILRDLQLERHGYKVHPLGLSYQAFAGGRSLKIYADDARRNHEAISKFSKKDADAMPKWDAWLAGVAAVLGPMLMQVPPKVGSLAPGDLLDQLRTAWHLRGLGVRGVGGVSRLFTMSLTDLLDDWLESEQVKACLTINGVIGAGAGPDEPGTAYVMLHHSIGDLGDGHLGGWGVPEGGMGAVAGAIRRAGESFGCEIRTGARVAKVLVRDGRVRGAVLESGEEILAPRVVTAVHPKIAFLDHLDRSELPGEFVRDIETWKTRSGVVKINVAISELPDFVANPGAQPQDHHSGSVSLCLSPAYAERAFQDAKAGRAAERPFVEGVIPTFWDRTPVPEGVHVFSMFTQWVPHEWARQPQRAELEAYADRVIDGYNALAPNFKASVIAPQVIGPYDMEQALGLIGGNVFHGELSVDQLFHMRPAPATATSGRPSGGSTRRARRRTAGAGSPASPATRRSARS